MPKLLQCVYSLCLILSFFNPFQQALALEIITFELPRLESDSWHAESVLVKATLLDASHIQFDIHIKKLSMPEPIGELKNVKLSCKKSRLTTIHVDCNKAWLYLKEPRLDSNNIGLSFSYTFSDKKLKLHMRNVRFAGGKADLKVNFSGKKWQITLSGDKLKANKLSQLANNLFKLKNQLTFNGLVSLDASISGISSLTKKITLDANINTLAFSNQEGDIAGEDLNIKLLTIASSNSSRKNSWHLKNNAQINDGVICLDWCWEIPKQGLHLSTNAFWDDMQKNMDISQFALHQPGITKIRGKTKLDFAKGFRVKILDIKLDKTSLSNLYHTYLQPVFIGTAADTLEPEGQIEGELSYNQYGSIKSSLKLDDIFIDEQSNRFGISGLSGILHWDNSDRPLRSMLSWKSGHLTPKLRGAPQCWLLDS